MEYGALGAAFRCDVQTAAVRASLLQARRSMVQADHSNILVVDDDPTIRKMIVASLRRDGYNFFEAANGREALEAMHDKVVNLVLLDLMMPYVSGWDVLKEREKDSVMSRIPVVIVSANRGPEVADAVNRGVCAYLPKPFDLTALHAIVRSCLESPRHETAAMRDLPQ